MGERDDLQLIDIRQPGETAGGFRSSIGASRLTAAGFIDVSDLLGGYGAWAAARPEVAVS